MPPAVAGVMNVRGRIVTIVDLRKMFELPASGLTELSQLIVLQDRGLELGLLADSVEAVRQVESSAIQAGLPTLTGVRERFLRGVLGQTLAIVDGALLVHHSIVGEEVA